MQLNRPLSPEFFQIQVGRAGAFAIATHLDRLLLPELKKKSKCASAQGPAQAREGDHEQMQLLACHSARREMRDGLIHSAALYGSASSPLSKTLHSRLPTMLCTLANGLVHAPEPHIVLPLEQAR
eukprot:scaffold281129_cov40-Tisochrysis_lutea.AAC.2